MIKEKADKELKNPNADNSARENMLCTRRALLDALIPIFDESPSDSIVTFGDCFTKDEVKKFYYDEKNRLPIIVGINEFESVKLLDASKASATTITGKPRAGKSWYIFNILMSLILFNTPEQVQLLIIDPKESNLFKPLEFMPHVMGLHNGDAILQIYKEIVEVEVTKRKRLLEKNQCDSIWELWGKGVKLPVLYIVVDEVLSIQNRLGVDKTIFVQKMKLIISQLPAMGIHLVFGTDKTSSVVDKTSRQMINFEVATMPNPEDVQKMLSIKKWDRTLIRPGDCVVNYEGEIMYVKGVLAGTSEDKNSDIVLEAAKVFYKMGVDQYDMSHLGVCYTRDENKIRRKLELDAK